MTHRERMLTALVHETLDRSLVRFLGRAADLERPPPPDNAGRLGPTRNDRASSDEARDAESPGEATRNKSRPNAGPRPAGADSSARTSAPRGSSQVGATPLMPVPQGLIGESIETALSDGPLELAVPGRSVELSEPGSQRDQVFVGKVADCVLNLIDCAHCSSVSAPIHHGQVVRDWGSNSYRHGHWLASFSA